MKKYLIIFASAVVALLFAACGAHRSQAYYDYESKVIQSHGDGSYVVRAWGRGRNAAHSYEVAQKQALQDIIFKGVQAQSSNIEHLKPLCFDMNARETHEDYFNNFFSDKGPWKKFIAMKDRRTFTTKRSRTDAQTLGQVTVTVYRSELKKQLQADGIIK